MVALVRTLAYATGRVSIPVAMERLRVALEERGPAAYVLTVSDDGRPHAVHGAVRWEDGLLVVEVGRRTAANVTARPSVSLLYPVRAADDYSLIVDGTGTVATTGDGHRLVITPTKAVLHRPAPAPDARTLPCEADCVPLLSTPTRSRD